MIDNETEKPVAAHDFVEEQMMPVEPDEPKHADGHCSDCGGPCMGHPNIYCDHVGKLVNGVMTKVICTHAPGSRACDHTTLHDDDEISAQAVEAKRRKTRKYSRDDKR